MPAARRRALGPGDAALGLGEEGLAMVFEPIEAEEGTPDD